MKNDDISGHPLRKQNLDYFTHVVRVAKADNVLSSSELDLLNLLGKKMGYSDPDIEALILATNKSDYIPPYELFERFEQLYGIIKMTLADGVIDKSEMRFASSFAIKSGFPESEVPRLLVLLLSGIRQGKDEDELFAAYRKEGNCFQVNVFIPI